MSYMEMAKEIRQYQDALRRVWDVAAGASEGEASSAARCVAIASIVSQALEATAKREAFYPCHTYYVSGTTLNPSGGAKLVTECRHPNVQRDPTNIFSNESYCPDCEASWS